MAHIFRGTLREEAGALVEVPPDVLAAALAGDAVSYQLSA